MSTVELFSIIGFGWQKRSGGCARAQKVESLHIAILIPILKLKKKIQKMSAISFVNCNETYCAHLISLVKATE